MARSLYPDDLVTYQDLLIGLVLRTYGSVDTHVPEPSTTEDYQITRHEDVDAAAFDNFLRDGVPPKGTVMLRWNHNGAAQIIHESVLKPLDRSLLIGDVVKRYERDAMSGVITNTYTKCSLLPIQNLKYKDHTAFRGHVPPVMKPKHKVTVSGEQPSRLAEVPTSELVNATPLMADDLITYKNWLGRINTLHYSIAIKLLDNSVVEISEDSAETLDDESDEGLYSFCVGDIALSKKGTLRREGKWIFGQYNPNTPPIGTVVNVRCVSAEVLWLQRRIGSREGPAPSGVLERLDLESGGFIVYDRTRRPKKLGQSSEVSNSELELHLGSRVRFKDMSGACVKYPDLQRIDRRDTLGYDINVFEVLLFQTEVDVQWQDLSATHEKSIDLVPDNGIEDEHDVWPGEIVHTLDIMPVTDQTWSEKPSKVGVVQRVNATERMATIKWCPEACLQYIRGPGEDSTPNLISQVVKVASGEVEEISLYDVEAPAALNVRRGDIVLLIRKGVTDAAGGASAGDVDWLGEIIDTRLDGRLTVRLGAAETVVDVTINREDCIVAVRSDGSDADDEFDDEDPEGIPNFLLGRPFDDSSENDIDDGDESDIYDLRSWGDQTSDDEMHVTYEDENGEPMDEDEVQDPDWESEEEVDTVMQDIAPETPPTSNSSTPLQPAKTRPGAASEPSANISTSISPPAYDTLDTAVPGDHHWATSSQSENAILLKRIVKEHKILRSPANLPPGVYIRTWETRLDLLRAVIIGPADTPYEDAPFIIDFHLPSKFPSEPPELFFHSWAGEPGLGGIGRVNPNLYEDGKICLSLLGTWDGEKGESWVANKSTLLQVIVSILGLVLVKEPYFNEAGYEPLAGLESSKRPSATYNERTYLRSRSFILAALKGLKADSATKVPGVGGVEDILRWQYTAPGGPRGLEKAIEHAQTILKRSDMANVESDGLTVMSKGACIPLRRVVNRLEQVQG